MEFAKLIIETLELSNVVVVDIDVVVAIDAVAVAVLLVVVAAIAVDAAATTVKNCLNRIVELETECALIISSFMI